MLVLKTLPRWAIGFALTGRKGMMTMTDREKIINAIEKAKKQSEEYDQDCIIVPFK